MEPSTQCVELLNSAFRSTAVRSKQREALETFCADDEKLQLAKEQASGAVKGVSAHAQQEAEADGARQF